MEADWSKAIAAALGALAAIPVSIAGAIFWFKRMQRMDLREQRLVQSEGEAQNVWKELAKDLKEELKEHRGAIRQQNDDMRTLDGRQQTLAAHMRRLQSANEYLNGQLRALRDGELDPLNIRTRSIDMIDP